MERRQVLRQSHSDALTAMRREITELLASPAEYLDAQRTAGRTTGKELYERYDEIRSNFLNDFQEQAHRTPIRSYETDQIGFPLGSLRQDDLRTLDEDISVFLSILSEIK